MIPNWWRKFEAVRRTISRRSSGATSRGCSPFFPATKRDAQKVEDLAQETFLKAWRALDQYDARRGPFEHWLSRIAVHAALDHLRRERRDKNEIALSELGELALEWLQSENTESRPEAADAREILNLAMRQLSAEETLVITLQEIEGRSAKEISRITGWSGVAVRVRAHRAAGEAAPGSDPIGEKQPVRDLRQSRRLEIVNGAKPYIPAASALRQVEDIRVTPCSGLFPLTPALSLRFPSPIGWERGQG